VGDGHAGSFRGIQADATPDVGDGCTRTGKRPRLEGTDNGLGIAGAAWNAIVLLDSRGYGSASRVAEGIVWAADERRCDPVDPAAAHRARDHRSGGRRRLVRTVLRRPARVTYNVIGPPYNPYTGPNLLAAAQLYDAGLNQLETVAPQNQVAKLTAVLPPGHHYYLRVANSCGTRSPGTYSVTVSVHPAHLAPALLVN
jgi:hypothetical protein